jgi:hypothetical protein
MWPQLLIRIVRRFVLPEVPVLAQSECFVWQLGDESALITIVQV